MANPLLNFRTRPEIAAAVRKMEKQDRRPVAQYLANVIEDYVLVGWRAGNGSRDGLPDGGLRICLRTNQEGRQQYSEVKKIQSVH